MNSPLEDRFFVEKSFLKSKTKSYYQRNRIQILQKSKERYEQLKREGVKRKYYKKKHSDERKSSGKTKLTEEENYNHKNEKKILAKLRIERITKENPPKPKGRPLKYI
jgi:hypothetical protein